MQIAVTGSTGLIGTALVKSLEAKGHQVRPMVRGTVHDHEREIHWHPTSRAIEASKLEGIDAVVHLGGKNVACRWTEDVKKQICDSRIESTRLIAETLSGLTRKPAVLVTASAIGYYGDTGTDEVCEEGPTGTDFLARLCQKWEVANEPAWKAGIRVVEPRIGVVLSDRGGALKKMLRPFKLGVGGVIGNGHQYMSWIALDDVVGAIETAIENDQLHGAVNAVAPHPVTNREFTKTLGRVLGRPTLFPMPAFAARLAFGDMADALLLASTRVIPHRLQQTGYRFAYPELEPALQHLLAN
jgi:hypothetical protein